MKNCFFVKSQFFFSTLDSYKVGTHFHTKILENKNVTLHLKVSKSTLSCVKSHLIFNPSVVRIITIKIGHNFIQLIFLYSSPILVGESKKVYLSIFNGQPSMYVAVACGPWMLWMLRIPKISKRQKYFHSVL